MLVRSQFTLLACIAIVCLITSGCRSHSAHQHHGTTVSASYTVAMPTMHTMTEPTPLPANQVPAMIQPSPNVQPEAAPAAGDPAWFGGLPVNVDALPVGPPLSSGPPMPRAAEPPNMPTHEQPPSDEATPMPPAPSPAISESSTDDSESQVQPL